MEKYNKIYLKKLGVKEKRRLTSRTWYELIGKARNLTPQGKYSMYKSSCKQSGRSFNLTFDEFMIFWGKPCFYCGDTPVTTGLDRVNNDIGYESKNIVPCCMFCNFMKRSFPQKEFIKQCVKIAQNH